MQIYSAIFPVTESLTQELLIRLVIEWNQGSPHNKISDLNWDGEKRNIKFEDENLSLAIEEFRAHNTIAVRFHQLDGNNIIWNTDIVVNFNTHVFSIKIDRETTADTIGFVPKFKAPVLVNMLLSGGYVGTDHGMQISDQAISITKDNYKLIEEIICRNTVYDMPVIYVTKYRGKYPLKPWELAYRLRGVAHVLTEEDAEVTKILKESCNGMNAHHGSIGIYYPGNSALYKIIPTKEYEEKENVLLDRITNIVHRYMNQQARDKMMTWEGIQNEILKLRYMSAKEKRTQAENEVSEVYENFSSELEEKERTIEELNNRIIALQAENQGLRAKYDPVSEIPLLYYGEEEELYKGEIKDHVIEMLQRQLSSQVEKGTRKEHILQDILKYNKSEGVLDEKRAEIKRILKGYTKVGDSLKRDLKEFGFNMTKDGGHNKLVYNDDNRYLFTMASSGSDSQHGGGNLSSEIIKRML